MMMAFRFVVVVVLIIITILARGVDERFDALGLAAGASDASIEIFSVFQSVHDRFGNLFRKLVEDFLRVEWTCFSGVRVDELFLYF